jgi:CheY-like chemotaxis protein
MNILIVDDDRAVREMLVETLVDEGYEAAGVSDGIEALRYLHDAAEQPCVILLDLMMPRMDGWQFLHARQDFALFAAIPVVLLSARPDAHEHAANLPVADYLAKPIDFNRLLGLLRHFCYGEPGAAAS